LAIARDITELKESERALRQQDDQIRHAQKMEAVDEWRAVSRMSSTIC